MPNAPAPTPGPLSELQPAVAARESSRVQLLGLILGPALFLLILMLLPAHPHPTSAAATTAALSPASRAVLAVAALVATWWLTEAVPLAVASLLPMVLLPLLGATTPKDAAAPYADELVFLFLGGLFLGTALKTSGLHARVALLVISVFGLSPSRVILGVMTITACISLFVSNTATAVMMTPIALSLINLADTHARSPASCWSERDTRSFASAMLISVAFAAGIGGMGTIIGTPPNAIMAAYLARELGRSISFLQWMLLCVPIVVLLLLLTWLMLTRVLLPVRAPTITASASDLVAARAALGPIRPEELLTLTVFCLSVVAWVCRPWISLPQGVALTDAGIAILAAAALFIIPLSRRSPARRVLRWSDAAELPWGVLILFGGGLSIAEAMRHTALDTTVGSLFHALSGLPEWGVLLAIALIIVVFSELAGNTAVATTAVPILGAACTGLNLSPTKLLLLVALTSSCGFMLPVSTPPNTIVFSTGRVPVRDMLRAGLTLDILFVLVLVPLFALLGDAALRWVGLS